MSAVSNTPSFKDDQHTFEPLGTFDLFSVDEDDQEEWFQNADLDRKGANNKTGNETYSHGDSDDEDDGEKPPSYLMKAILAGLYELPPPHILKYQTGWGRRIRYRSAHRLVSSFIPVPEKLQNSRAKNNSLERMALRRYSGFDENGLASEASDFDIFRVTLADGYEDLNQKLVQQALLEEKESEGLDVSNAGGAFHGQPNFLEGSASCQQMLYQHIRSAIEQVQSLYPPSQGRYGNNNNNNILRLEPKEIECWVNISRDGSWNRLHTHEGSAWSGVYYVQTPLTKDSAKTTNSYNGGGRLVLKPTPHPVEDTYQLDHHEKARLRSYHPCDKYNWVDETGYLDIEPVAGNMIIFPSFLHHCVLPSSMTGGDVDRISIAFNVNWQ